MAKYDYAGHPIPGLRTRTRNATHVPLPALVIHTLRTLPVGSTVDSDAIVSLLPEQYAITNSQHPAIRAAIARELHRLASLDRAPYQRALLKTGQGRYRTLEGVYRPQNEKERKLGLPPQ